MCSSDLDAGAEPTSDAHFGDRDGEPTLADVVACTNGAHSDRFVDSPVAGRGMLIGCWYDTTRRERNGMHHREVASAEFVGDVTDVYQHVPRLSELGSAQSFDVGNVGDGRDSEGCWSSGETTVAGEVFIVEGIAVTQDRDRKSTRLNSSH